MLTNYRTHERRDPDGARHMTFGPEIDDEPCALCGGESVPRLCERCGKHHHHGRVHIGGNHLNALCRTCPQF